MECTLGLFAAASGGGSEADASRMDIVEKDYVGFTPKHQSETELELGLGLTLGGGGGGRVNTNNGSAWGERGRILTAQDFPVVHSHGRKPDSLSVSGTKRSAADSLPHDGGSPTSFNQVVGWPPIRTYRMNSLVNQAKTARAEEEDIDEEKDQSKDSLKKKICNDVNKTNASVEGKGKLGFVKVNVDGLVIGRKVDLNAHSSYETLALMLEDMFFKSAGTVISNEQSGDKEQARKLSKLLDGSSEFVLTYEDKEGDWMLVGDVPWGMFLSSVRRLRIMKTSEANGLAPRCQDKKVRQRNKPI